MHTQIAPTPTVKGSEADRIYKEANKLPSLKTRTGADKLKQLFSKLIKK